MLGQLCPRKVDLLGPLKGGGNQAHVAAGDGHHAADAGRAALCALNGDHGLAHAQRGDVVDVARQDADDAVLRAHRELFRLALKGQTVWGDDLQMEGHFAFPFSYFATTSSMVPAKRK